MQQYGLITLTVRAMSNVLLFLDADRDDPIPQAPSDQRITETMHRGTAERNLSQYSNELTVAHEVGYAVNTLPRDQASSETERQMARNAAMQRSNPVDAMAYAKDVFFACRSVTDNTIIKCNEIWYSYRACLGVMHDKNALKGGS